MANRIFNISGPKKPLKINKEIYKDISMLSKSKPLPEKFNVARSINQNAVQNAIHNIFTWIPGERILNPEFGTKLYYYLYNGITEFTVNNVIEEIEKAIMTYEPRVVIGKIDNLTTLENNDDNTIVLKITYMIKGLPDEVFEYTYRQSKIM